jgi:hypothetical protein
MLKVCTIMFISHASADRSHPASFLITRKVWAARSQFLRVRSLCFVCHEGCLRPSVTNVCAAPIKLTSVSTRRCAMPTGAPGNIVAISISQTAGGPIWIARSKKLTSSIKPGPALVQPAHEHRCRFRRVPTPSFTPTTIMST